MAGTVGYNFSANTTIRSSEVNQNFEWFRGHYIPITQSGTWANTTGIYDLGSAANKWRDLHLSRNANVGGDLALTGSVTTGQIGSGILKTSSGSSTSAGNAAQYVTMNDYSFFPAVTSSNSSTASIDAMPTSSSAHPDGVIGKLRVAAPGNPVATTSATTKIQWRYITASDQPTIWLAHKPAGTIMAIWMSDDPTPGNVPGVESPGCVSIKINRSNLDILFPQLSDISREFAKQKASSPDREAFHAVSKEWPDAGGEIIKRCRMNMQTKLLELK